MSWLGTTGKSEADTPRNGFLSYSREWHALGVGLYMSLKSPRPRPGSLAAATALHEDVAHEPHYFKLGYLLGTTLQVLGVVVALRALLDAR